MLVGMPWLKYVVRCDSYGGASHALCIFSDMSIRPTGMHFMGWVGDAHVQCDLLPDMYMRQGYLL